MERKDLLQQLANEILSIKRDHPIRVGIDGVDGSGKTTLANELAEYMKGSKIIRASIDGFHNPRAVRYARGRLSPEGYYLDSFNIQAIIDNLLIPLGPNGNLKYKTATFDYRTDSKVDAPELTADKDSILIMEGIFLYRPEFSDYWDLKIFVDVDFVVSVSRAIEREGGVTEEITEQYEKRYVPGQKMYFKEANPKAKAHIIIDNSVFEKPRLQIVRS